MNRLLLLIRRCIRAAKLGFFFRGTSSFRCPTALTVGGNQIALKVPESNKGVHTDFMNILIDDEYELKSLRECRTILDIGANVGLFSLWARMRFPDARIVAVEPNPAAFRFLQHNVSALKIEIHPIALGLCDGTISIDSDTDITCCKVKVTSNGNVAMTRFSTFVNRNISGTIDLLKMDCEGFEWELFKDGAAFEKVDRIHMEYHLIDNRTLAEFKSLVAEAGYSISQIVENQGFGTAFLVRSHGGGKI
jgi:FkbM family methyltransferase